MDKRTGLRLHYFGNFLTVSKMAEAVFIVKVLDHGYYVFHFHYEPLILR